MLPTWLIATLFGRDLLLGLCCLLYRAHLGKFEAKPIPTGKIHTFFQIILVALILAHASILPDIPTDILAGLMRVLVITAITSLLGYAHQWYRDAQAAYYQKLHDAEKQT